MLPGNLLHPLKLDVVGFKEEDHDYPLFFSGIQIFVFIAVFTYGR